MQSYCITIKDMNQYYATFISGTSDIIMRRLKKLPINQLKVSYIEDGLVTFSSSYPPERIIEFSFFNNTFLVLKDFGVQSTSNLEKMATTILSQSLPDNKELSRLMQGRRIRLAAVEESQLVKLANHHNLEQHIIQQLGSGEAGVAQFQLILRRSGKGLFSIRLARPRYKRLNRPAGALRAELVNILCLVANINSKDIVLDPFAGYGTIIDECLDGFHARKVIAVELDEKLAKQLESSHKNKNLEAVHGTATNLSFIDDNSVNKIITDPPWGLYGNLKQQELLDLYEQSLNEMARVLKSGGIAVILSGNSYLTSMTQSVKQLERIKTYNILVSGKKASIIKLRKRDTE